MPEYPNRQENCYDFRCFEPLRLIGIKPCHADLVVIISREFSVNFRALFY